MASSALDTDDLKRQCPYLCKSKLTLCPSCHEYSLCKRHGCSCRGKTLRARGRPSGRTDPVLETEGLAVLTASDAANKENGGRTRGSYVRKASKSFLRRATTKESQGEIKAGRPACTFVYNETLNSRAKIVETETGGDWMSQVLYMCDRDRAKARLLHMHLEDMLGLRERGPLSVMECAFLWTETAITKVISKTKIGPRATSDTAFVYPLTT